MPGIAGLILTLGMAIDANIIIFARIREEMDRGESVYSAVNEGFSKAFVAILDSNVTTLFAAMVLLLDLVRLRASTLTLSIGVMVSMFSIICDQSFS